MTSEMCCIHPDSEEGRRAAWSCKCNCHWRHTPVEIITHPNIVESIKKFLDQ